MDASAEIPATREAIIGTRKTPAEIALAFGCCERAIWNVIEQHNVPYIKFLGRRYADPKDVAAALLTREVRRQPRRAGRPANQRAA